MKPLTDEDRKRLTLYLGLCYHERPCNVPASDIVYRCVKCKTAVYPISEHTFATYEDLGKLKDKLVENGEWDEFYNYCRYEISPVPGSDAKSAAWLFRPESCALVAEYLKQKEGK